MSREEEDINQINFKAGVKGLAEKWQLGGTVGDQVNFSVNFVLLFNFQFVFHFVPLFNRTGSPCSALRSPGWSTSCPASSTGADSISIRQNPPTCRISIYLSLPREEHRPGECHGDTVEEWEVRDAAYHHCPGIIRLLYHYFPGIIRLLYHYLSSLRHHQVNNKMCT